MEVARAGAHDQVEVAEPARGHVEGGHAAGDHVAVEDHGRVGAALVGGEEVDDRVAAGLLLAVAGEAEVDRERALGGELLRRLQQQVELALVVGDAAPVEPLVADRRLERLALPELERVGRLHVEVPVAEDGRRLVGPGRGADLADRERLPLPVDDLGCAAGGADVLAQPFPGRARRAGAPGRR